jgi:hypothetical protein
MDEDRFRVANQLTPAPSRRVVQAVADPNDGSCAGRRVLDVPERADTYRPGTCHRGGCAGER